MKPLSFKLLLTEFFLPATEKKNPTNMDVLLVCHFKFWIHILLHEQSPVHLATHWRTHRLYPVFDYYRLTWYTFMKNFFEYVNFFHHHLLKKCPLSTEPCWFLWQTQCYWCVWVDSWHLSSVPLINWSTLTVPTLFHDRHLDGKL